MDRMDIAFDSGGERCAAWLYRPESARPWPCVVMAHGLGTTREAGLDRYAERFAGTGIAALVFDYRHFGASGGEPRQLVSIGRQLEDWRAALAHARARPELDPERIGLWGTSFAGGHVIGTAARDGRVACVVSQIPHVDGIAALRELPARTAVRLTAAGLGDAARAVLRRSPRMVPIVGPPGSVAALTAPDAEPGLHDLYPGDFRNELAARVMLAIPTYRPIRSAPKVHCPILFCIADRDTITPPGPVAKAADAAPRGEALRYDAVHYDIYQGELFERVVSDQTKFLARHLLGKDAHVATPAA